MYFFLVNIFVCVLNEFYIFDKKNFISIEIFGKNVCDYKVFKFFLKWKNWVNKDLM